MMKHKKLYMAIIFMLMVSMTSCAQYLYTAYIPLAAYNVAEGVKGGPGVRYASADSQLGKLNSEMKQDGFSVTLADTYEHAYGKSFKDLPPDGDTGQAFSDMKTATQYFRGILKANQVGNADNFVLTRIDSKQEEDFSLIAVVYRPEHVISVRDEGKPGTWEILTPESPDYYRPYKIDGKGKPLDVVVDWAVVPVNCFEKQSQQAIFLTATANDVLEKKTAGNFWRAMGQWEKGDIGSVVVSQNYLACQTLTIAKG